LVSYVLFYWLSFPQLLRVFEISANLKQKFDSLFKNFADIPYFITSCQMGRKISRARTFFDFC
jgi:hypothetical protein